MRLLITGANSRLGRALAGALSNSHHVRTLDRSPAEAGAALAFAGDLRDRAIVADVPHGK